MYALGRSTPPPLPAQVIYGRPLKKDSCGNFGAELTC